MYFLIMHSILGHPPLAIMCEIKLFIVTVNSRRGNMSTSISTQCCLLWPVSCCQTGKFTWLADRRTLQRHYCCYQPLLSAGYEGMKEITYHELSVQKQPTCEAAAAADKSSGVTSESHRHHQPGGRKSLQIQPVRST